MKKLMILLVLLAMVAGCATTNPKTQVEWDEFLSQKPYADVIEQLRYESQCNLLVYMHVWGESLREVEKMDGLVLPSETRYAMADQISKRIGNSKLQQTAVLEMFTMGYNRAPFDTAVSQEMKTCLETDASRMQKFHELKLKQTLDAYRANK